MAKLINILLRKSDPDYPWGFSLGAQPPAQHSVQITWVDNGSLAAKHLEAGDRVLEIEGVDTAMLSNAEVDSILSGPSQKLELLIMKKPKAKIQPNISSEGQSMERTHEYSEKKIESTSEEFSKTETINGTNSFWTSPPADLKTFSKFEETSNDYISESSIFQNLNAYNDCKRQIDPREEKRRFWESCRKGDSIRRFKWGDSIKPGRVNSPSSTKSDGSTDQLYFKSEVTSSQTEHVKERSKSCEPPISKNPFVSFAPKPISPSNPFYNDTKSNTDGKEKHKSDSRTNKLNEFERILTGDSSEQTVKTEPVDIPLRSKGISKEEFDTKCRFFERATSAPVCCVNKNAKDLVEERLKDGGSPSVDGPIRKATSPSYGRRSLDSSTSDLKEEFSCERSSFSHLPDTYETRVIKESYEKVTRNRSPCDSLGAECKREYAKEVKSCSSKRSDTPCGFYDNYEEKRPISPMDISFSSFNNLRRTLGSLLGGTPLPVMNSGRDLKADQRIEEAFQELAMKEELIDETAKYDCYYECTRQSSQIASGNGGNSPSACGPPPPPPPMGSVPPTRIASEIGPSKKSYEPPAAIQNAMMTKDKKPFTYTPGGLDLAEIRSPRMAKRINRNAHMEDSCTPPEMRQTAPQHHQPLPPSALAAMQPQIAIPVFPSGGPMGPASHQSGMTHGSQPPPPPPPPNSAGAANIPPPPPPPPANFAPPAPPPPTAGNQQQQNGAATRSPPAFLQDIQNRPQLRSVGPINQNKPVADFVAEIPVHAPLKPVNQPPRSCYDPASNSNSIQVQLKPVSPKPDKTETSSSPVDFVQSPPPGAPYNPPQPQVQYQPTQPQFHPAHFQPQMQQQFQPVQQPQFQPAQQQQFQLPQQQSYQPPRQPTQTQQTKHEPPRPTLQMPSHSTTSPQSPPNRSTVTSPTNVNKSPSPWMAARPAQKEPQPPWTVRQNTTEEKQHSSLTSQTSQGSAVMRVIPIQMEGTPSPGVQATQPPFFNPHLQNQQHFNPPPFYTNQPIPNNAQNESQQPRTRIIPIQMEGANDNAATQQPRAYSTQQSSNGGPPSSDIMDGRRPLQTQTSWPGNPIQSRSFRVLQKITGSEDEATGPYPPPEGETFLVNRVYSPQAATPGADSSKCWDPNTPHPIYPNPNYWYYPPQTPEEQQQFWEHYNAMCAYMAQMNAAAYRYSPYPMYPYFPPYPSDSEEYSGYSSSDEMTYYGQMFKKQAQMAQQAQAEMALPMPPLLQVEKVPSETSVGSEDTFQGSSEQTSDAETEVGDEQPLNLLKSVRSVPNISVYNDSDSDTEGSEEESEPESELPHQLSVIFEESELSSDAESSRKAQSKYEWESDYNSSSTTLNNQDETEEDADATVTVRLPLQFKFSRSSDNEEVTTMIVGNSEMEPLDEPKEGSLIITEIVKEGSDPDVTATIRLPNRKTSKSKQTNSEFKSGSESPIDFWKEVRENEKASSAPSNATPPGVSEDDSKLDESDCHWEDDSSSTSVQTVKKGQSESENSGGSEIEGGKSDEVVGKPEETKEEKDDDNDEEEEEEEKAYLSVSSSSDEEEEDEEEDEEEEEEEEGEASSVSSVSDDSESSDTNSSCSEPVNKVPDDKLEIPEPIAIPKTVESLKSQEESEEDDSGVTSDLSRHISETDTDPECGSELRKMSRYQRAATHSRLFKLLQEECGAEEEEQPLAARKERLTLPLTSTFGEQESLSSSSGINSPSSPTSTDRLVKELVQSLLSRKKGRHFRKLPLEKLHAAALRILQEDMDPYDTGSTSDESSFFLSPVAPPNRNESKVDIPNPEAYGGNYYDYCKYYSSWGNADSYESTPDYDILPSKAFKFVQENTLPDTHSAMASPIRGVSVRCPRVNLTCATSIPSSTSTSTVPSTVSPSPSSTAPQSK